MLGYTTLGYARSLLGTSSAGTTHGNTTMQPSCNTMEVSGILFPVKSVKSPLPQGAIDMDVGDMMDCLFSLTIPKATNPITFPVGLLVVIDL